MTPESTRLQTLSRRLFQLSTFQRTRLWKGKLRPRISQSQSLLRSSLPVSPSPRAARLSATSAAR